MGKYKEIAMFEKNHNKMEREFPFMPEVIAKIAENPQVDMSKFGQMFEDWPYYAKVQKVDPSLMMFRPQSGFHHGHLYWADWWQSVSIVTINGEVLSDIVPPTRRFRTEYPEEISPENSEGDTVGETLKKLQAQGLRLEDITHVVSIKGHSEDTKGWELEIDVFKTKGRSLEELLVGVDREGSNLVNPRQKKIKRQPRPEYQKEFEKFLESLNGTNY